MVKENTNIKIIFILLIIFSLGLSILSYVRSNSIVNAAGDVNHTNLVKLELKNVYSNLRDMESGIRGYVITSKPFFLENFYKDESIIVVGFNRLDSMTNDNPLQQKNLVGLHLLVNKKIEWLKSQIDTTYSKKITVQKVLESQVVMKDVHIQIDKMTDAENKLLEKRSLELDKKELQTPRIAISFALISILILVVLYLKTMKSLRLEVSNKTNELADSLESVLQKNIELVRLNKELESINYVSSHDLQEPLRKMQVFASKIETDEHENLSETVKYSIKRVSESAKRMQMLVQDFMAYARTTDNGLKFEDIYLDEVIDEVKTELIDVISEKNAIIEVSQLCKAHIIRSQFRQLLNNVISNSLKYSNPEVPLRIIINGIILKGHQSKNHTLLPEKNYCQISISDNGIGFDPIYNVRVFDIFSRLHNEKQYEGTGIGLSLVKKIVENHSGFVTAIGVLGKGLTIEIIIPSPEIIVPSALKENLVRPLP